MMRTLRSTTGTAPITFARSAPGLVRIDLADGSSQVYDEIALATAVLFLGPALSDRASRIESAPTDASTSTGARPTPTEEESNVNKIVEQSVEAGREHHGWCDRVQCTIADEYSSHYSVAQVPTIDQDETNWRNKPQGAPEIQVRRFDFDGHAGVELNLGDFNSIMSTSGSIGVSWLTPDEARAVAAILTRLADDAEAGAA